MIGVKLDSNLSRLFTPNHIKSLPYETPYFLLSKQCLKDRYVQFKQLFPDAEVCYAMKANSEPHVLKTLADAGSSFEVATKYEITMLEKLGISGSRIIFGTAVKPPEHIKEAYKYGVDRFACDSLQELERLAVLAPGSRVYVRVRVDDTGSVFSMSEKFGASPESAAALLVEAKKLGLRPYGLSFMVGSQAAEAAIWGRCIRDLASIMTILLDADINIEVINIGGGYPSLYASHEDATSLEEIAKEVEQARQELPYETTLLMEPGRGLVAESAVLVVSVVSKLQRPGGTWLYLDAGSYNALFESMVMQGTMRYHTEIVAAGKLGDKVSHFVLTGPTGDGLDVVSYDAVLPSAIKEGDKIIFYHVGAYSLTLASPFNGFPRPDVYFQ